VLLVAGLEDRAFAAGPGVKVSLDHGDDFLRRK
jgi:hypothetical protein